METRKLSVPKILSFANKFLIFICKCVFLKRKSLRGVSVSMLAVFIQLLFIHDGLICINYKILHSNLKALEQLS